MISPADARPNFGDLPTQGLQRYSDNPSGFLTLNRGNAYFTTADLDGFVCYRSIGKYWIQFGGPFAATADRRELQRRFLLGAAEAKRHVVAVQLQREDAELLEELGYIVNQVGASYAIELAGFSLRGKHFVRLRNKISRANRAGLEITEVSAFERTADLEQIDEVWLRDKGRHTKELEFLIGEVGGPAQPLRKLFLGKVDGQPVGYISYAPVYGSRPGWLHDLSRRVPDAAPGVMEAINLHAIEQFRRDGSKWLHFGFTPFVALDAKYDLPTASKSVSRIVRLLAERGSKIYPAKTQVEYKLKWNPSLLLPEYVGFHKKVRPGAVFSLLRITNSI